MPYFVVWADKNFVSRNGFGRVAHVPCIFHSSWRYHRESSTYLIEKATCTWPDAPDPGVRRYLTRRSLLGYAESLTNFLEWAEMRSIDWRAVSYTEHIYEGYQQDMLKGRWSQRGESLSPTTINLRVDEACRFLKWAAARGLRDEFLMLTELISRRDGIATNSHGHRAQQIAVRIGRVRPNPKSLRLPTDEEIGRWLRAVQLQQGNTKALMCRLVLGTGIRREEAAGWRIDTLPVKTNDWIVLGDQVKVTIKYGCKGQDYGEDHGDKIGPSRAIWMSMNMAYKIHEYRRGLRLQSRANWVRSAQNNDERRSRIAQPSPHLFLSEATGQRITAKTLYEAWTGGAFIPFDGWSPHGGRHWWACKVLLREHQKRRAILGQAITVVPLDWISGNARSDIDLLIKPQLGHIDKDTSDSYVTWATRILGNDGLQVAYQDYLDEIEAATNMATING